MILHQTTSIRRIPFCFGGRRLAILLIAWLALFAGINSIPLEDHEALVLQTSREMVERGDWVLPYFNQEPRLNKPPLSYWFTMGISFLDPFHSDIEPWHARACSMLGGLLLLLGVAYACERIYGGETGFLVALLLIGSKAFACFSHHARPDFLYAVFSVLQLIAWIGAWKAEDGSATQRLRAALGWGLAALAVLTKGPQIPVIFLLGFVLFLLCGDERRRTLKVVRPFSGVVILLAACLPWWLLLQQRLKTTGIDIAHTQLSGSLLKSLSGWSEILSFYYAFNILWILLPFSFFLPGLILWNRRAWRKPGDVERLLISIVLATLVVFTMVGHYRGHYMLPVFPLSIILLGVWATRTTDRRIPKMIPRVILGTGVVALASCGGLLLWQRQYASFVLLACTGVALGILLRKEARDLVWRENPLCLQLIGLSLLSVMLFAGFNAVPLRNESRDQTRNLALMIRQTMTPGDQLVSWRIEIDVLPYYTQQRVTRIDDLDELRDRYEKMGDGRNLYVIVPKKKAEMLGQVYAIEMLEVDSVFLKASKQLVCVRIMKARS